MIGIRGGTPLTNVFYHCATKYSKDQYLADTLHYAVAEGNLEAVHELLNGGANVYRTIQDHEKKYRTIQDGETALHVAIANGQREIYDILLGIYERDFDVVQRHLKERFGWNDGNRFWLKKRIAVATTEEQCKRAVDMEDSSGLIVDEDEVRMILLKNGCEASQVAVLRTTDANRKSVDSFICCLRPNGFLTWGFSGVEGNSETLLQLATIYENEQLVRKLIENGADTGQGGSVMNTPLMEACRKKNMALIKLFMEEFGDQLDPTVTNRVGESALTFVLQSGDIELFDYVLNKTISYRKAKFQESDSEAFNRCFHYDNPSWPEVSIWGMLDDRFKETVLEPYLERFEYDVSVRAGYHIVLMEMITRHIGRRYYQSEIRKKPELLELTDRDGCNIVHCLMWSNELAFIRELYETRGQQCQALFEKEQGAVICVASVLTHGNNDVMRFLFEHHLEYLRGIADLVMDSFIEEELLPSDLFDEPLHLWVQFLPEMQQRVTELEDKIAEEELERMREDNDSRFYE